MRRLLIVILSVAISGLLLSCTKDTEGSTQLERATVVYVVDGDTLCVQTDGIQGHHKIRLIGDNTPESVASDEYLESTGKQNTQEGVDASYFVKSIIHEGDGVYLQYDAEREDKYGRTLVYVWLEKPTNSRDIDEVRSKMLNAILLAEGFATVMPIEPNTAYASLLAKIAA